MKSHFFKLSSLLGLMVISAMSCSVQNNQIGMNDAKNSKNNSYYIKNPKELSKEEFTSYKIELPEIKREFRGVWIATVANINWPTKRNLTSFEQKTEALRLLDMLQEMNFNAVVLQVRPSADAIYQSNIEPWSVFLTGQIGKSPAPFYDPLEFWIEEAHKRDMELHVWINPYRAHHSNGGKLSNEAMAKKMPNEIVQLKNGMYWFDPSNKKTQDHVSKVVNDIVKRYDIDGVHFDDYFYPYASYNNGADFPDQNSWNAYKNAGGTLSKADWRRYNVNTFIERIYKEIKAEKKYVKFGISPFGIWKTGYPAGVSGMSQYDELFADAKLWLNNGWIDYFTPQLYWPIDAPRQSFTKLLSWWNEENVMKRHLWPGLNTVEIKATDKTTEIINQINATKNIVKQNVGTVHYSIAGLIQNPQLMKRLKEDTYKEKALIPATTWIPTEKLMKPKLSVHKNKENIELNWKNSNTNNVVQWVIFKRYGDQWETDFVKAYKNSLELNSIKNGKKLNSVAIKAIDRLGNESDYDALMI